LTSIGEVGKRVTWWSFKGCEWAFARLRQGGFNQNVKKE